MSSDSFGVYWVADSEHANRVNFDHTYWSFGGKGSKYNYVEAAVNAGYAVFSYDRLGS